MIHILLPVHNRADVTAQFVDALARQDMAEYRLLLIDDGCTDDTVERVRAAIPPDKLRVLAGNGNLWWAGALQQGYEMLHAEGAAPDDFVLIVNDDITFAHDFLRRGLEVLSERPGAAIQAVGVDRLTGTVDRGAVADLVRMRFSAATAVSPANCLSTRGLLMRASTFLSSGGFKPARLPHYLSDYEFTLRLRRQVVQLLCDDRFHASVRFELTGRDRYRRDGLVAFWTEAFSNRAKYNPRHASAFVAMACPAWVVPFQLARIWIVFAIAMVKASLGRPASPKLVQE